jgi:hypothetical protein
MSEKKRKRVTTVGTTGRRQEGRRTGQTALKRGY